MKDININIGPNPAAAVPNPPPGQLYDPANNPVQGIKLIEYTKYSLDNNALKALSSKLQIKANNYVNCNFG